MKHVATNLAGRTNLIARFGFGVATGFLGAMAMAAFGVGTMPALTAVAMGLRKIVMGNLALRRALAAGVLMAALWSIGMRAGVFGGGPMHHGHGIEPAPESPPLPPSELP
jgi:sulfite exporter TauE/SafE